MRSLESLVLKSLRLNHEIVQVTQNHIVTQGVVLGDKISTMYEGSTEELAPLVDVTVAELMVRICLTSDPTVRSEYMKSIRSIDLCWIPDMDKFSTDKITDENRTKTALLIVMDKYNRYHRLKDKELHELLSIYCQVTFDKFDIDKILNRVFIVG